MLTELVLHEKDKDNDCFPQPDSMIGKMRKRASDESFLSFIGSLQHNKSIEYEHQNTGGMQNLKVTPLSQAEKDSLRGSSFSSFQPKERL